MKKMIVVFALAIAACAGASRNVESRKDPLPGHWVGVIDLSSLAYADKQGERLLRDLAARAELRGCSPFLAVLLRRSQEP